MRSIRPMLVLALVAQGLMAGETAAFTAKPKAVKNGEVTQISFAVSAPTDAAVFIEDARGTIIRHLVAGVLGTNAPAPFKSGSLEQTVSWDGKADYGLAPDVRHLPPFRARVALGLKARYDQAISRGTTNFAGAISLGTGPDGVLYVRHSHGPATFGHAQVLALNRDGSYRRMLWPFAAMPGNQAAKGFPAMDLGGSLVPILKSERGFQGDIAGGFFQPGNLAVSRDGKSIYAATSSGIACFLAAGGCREPLEVPLEKGDKGGMGAKPTITCTAGLCISSDDKSLYLSGVADGSTGLSAIYRLRLPERTGQEIFFGDPRKAGNDPEHLGANPGGIASDGRGSLLVADTANDRVVIVGEADGKYRGEFKSANPEVIGVAPAQGAVYVYSRKSGLTKFALPAAPGGAGVVDWKGATQLCNTAIAFGRTDGPRTLAVDATADPVVIWVTAGYLGDFCRITDRAGKFEVAPIPVAEAGKPRTEEGYLGVVVDRRTKEVYARNGNFGAVWERVDDETGRSELLNGFPRGTGGTGVQVVPAPNGNLYGLQWPLSLYQWNRSGKLVPFAEPRRATAEEMKLNFPTRYGQMKNDIKNWDSWFGKERSYVPVAMGELPHTLGVRWSDGHLFVIEPYLYSSDRVTHGESCGGRIMKAMHEYLPSGKRVTTPDNPVLWKLTDAAVGPKFDAAGNIYVADIVRPRGWAFPPEFQATCGKPAAGQVLEGQARVLAENYGSIVKFSPKGGMIHYGGGKTYLGTAKPEPFEGTPKLEPGLKEIEADLFFRALSPVKITGAEWVHPGIGHIGLWGCNCENMTFDVDEFGRVFFPDFAMFQIRVIDTAGNSIVNVGGYGNADNCGSASAVIDPRTGIVRPRRPDDPKELVSPFAKPEIAMAWPTGVGVTDKHLYIGDAVNRRLLRADLAYAAEETCEIR